MLSRGHPPTVVHDDSNAELMQEAQRLESELVNAQADLAEHQQRIADLERWIELVLERLPADDTGVASERELEITYHIDELCFERGSSALSHDTRATLSQLAERLQMGDGPYWVEIRGHTDTSGAEQQNLELGRRRAEAVRSFLLRHTQLPAYRVAVISYGESRPLVSEGTAADRARNRRAEILVFRVP